MSLSLTAQGECKFRVGQLFKEGSVYTIYKGSFAEFSDVLIKRVSICDKKRADLARNEVSMMQKLHRSCNVVKILHVNVKMTTANIIVEECGLNLLQYLSSLVNANGLIKLYDEPTIFRQVLSGLSFLHERQIIHGDVRLRNCYFYTMSTSSWIIKLGGLQYSKTIDLDDWTESSDSAAPRPAKVDARKLPDSFQDDKYQVAVMLYFFTRRTYSRDRFSSGFVPDWSNDHTYDYKKLHAKHLINMIHSDPSLSIPDILHHPYFMSIEQIVAYEDRLRTYSARNRQMDPHLEQNKTEVFVGTWTRRVEPEVVRLCLHNSSAEQSFVGLWQARRNRRQHRDEDNELIRDLMGTLPTDNFEYWEGKFPAFFLHLFTRIAGYTEGGTFLYATKEFKRSVYFPASPEFYALCADTNIYN